MLLESVAESLKATGVGPKDAVEELPRNLQPSYRHFLSLSDGGYTSDGFIHFFGLGGPLEQNLLQWNKVGFWKLHFGLTDDTFVFAEDNLGTQFMFDVRGNRKVVKMLIPDGGKISLCANTFEEFLENEAHPTEVNARPRGLAARYFRETGIAFRPFTHISCKVPVMLGGSDEDVQNLALVNSGTNLVILGQVCVQVRKLPPGTKIREIRIEEGTGKLAVLPES